MDPNHGTNTTPWMGVAATPQRLQPYLHPIFQPGTLNPPGAIRPLVSMPVPPTEDRFTPVAVPTVVAKKEEPSLGVRMVQFFKVVVGTLLTAITMAPASKSPFWMIAGLIGLFNVGEAIGIQAIVEANNKMTKALHGAIQRIFYGNTKPVDDLTQKEKEVTLPWVSALVTVASGLVQTGANFMIGNRERQKSLAHAVADVTGADIRQSVGKLAKGTLTERFKQFGKTFGLGLEYLSQTKLFRFLQKYPAVSFGLAIANGLLAGYVQGVIAQKVSEASTIRLQLKHGNGAPPLSANPANPPTGAV